ncbi:hypothetical protein MMC17_010080 [Xylographa soralifera]|nr:hypothetical protein [Xylographa soralifera]
MALNDGPYYTTSSQAVEELQNHEPHNDQESMYPDLGPSAPDDAQMYALADNALQAHQSNTASHFAGLIQAATAAAGQEEISSQPLLHVGNQSRRATRKSRLSKHDGQDLEVRSGEQLQHTKSERASRQSRIKKRNRTSDGIVVSDDEGDFTLDGLDGQAPAPSDQAPVLHSASTLFRRPSSTSRKYTRPPMSKLFTSLELSPESFLQLQSAAKNYMLSDAFPDRRETVGQRGRGDSELVKLRLWNCVKDFLEGEGNGQRFFAPDIPGDEGVVRTMFWPSHKNNIITAVTPLLRRMVTNERQRQYAVETRKPGPTNDSRSNKKKNLTEASLHPLLESGSNTHHESGLDYGDTDLHRFFHDINGTGLKDYNAWETWKDPQLKPSFDVVREESGLPAHDLNGLIATIDYHLRMSHGTGMQDFRTCTLECETTVIGHMLSTGYMEFLSWRSDFLQNVGGTDSFAGSVLQMLFKLLKGQLSIDMPANRPVSASPQKTETFVPDTVPTQPGWPLEPNENLSNGRSPLEPLVLHLHFLRSGKRILPRLDLFADQYQDLSLFLQRAAEHHSGVVPETLKVMVLIPEGLKEINEDADWKTAIEISRSLDWMEGEVKVLVEV